jgi:hypothetical protein
MWNASDTPVSPCPPDIRCCFSQDGPGEDALSGYDDILSLLSWLSSDMGHVGATYVPANKSLSLLVVHTGVTGKSGWPLSIHPPAKRARASDPLDYYVYGLRKIVV